MDNVAIKKEHRKYIIDPAYYKVPYKAVLRICVRSCNHIMSRNYSSTAAL